MNAADVIDGRYRLERLLGTGGMAEVWLAEDERLGRWVAVKMLHESFQSATDADAIAAFEREARVIARLQHANIVAVYDAGTWEGRRFIVTEYVHGYSLRQILETQGRLTEAETIRYGTQIAAALQYAHEQGVIHCDIKPENILINETGVAKVADFGVAETVTRTLAPGQARDLLGTIAYLSPEVLQGSETDARSDVYSLGLTLYELVAGRLPFTGTSAAAMAGQRLTAPAAPLRTFARGASAELEGALARAIAISPDDRYPTAGAFGTALRRVPPAGGQPTPVIAPPGRPPQLRSRHQTARVRRPATQQQQSGVSGAALLITIGVILAGIGMGLAVALYLSNRDEGGGTEPTPTPSVTAEATEPVETETPESPTAAPTDEPTPEPSPSPSPSPTDTPTVPADTPTPTVPPSPSPTEDPGEATATPQP